MNDGKWVLYRVECLMFEADSWTELAAELTPNLLLTDMREMQKNEKDDNISYAIKYEIA